jgi:AcrR family transcriptional regulator
MKIHYTLDDSAARLPLAIRSADALWDRAAELRGAPGVKLVELTTQHLRNTGAALTDEMSHYLETGSPSDSDPYALEYCFTHRRPLEDLMRDLRETRPGLVALHQVAELFPLTFTNDLHLMLALTAVGAPAFGYVRTYKDSENDEYNGLVINLAQARPHLEETLGQYSLELLISVIRHGFFNHEAFLLAYAKYGAVTGRSPDKPAERLKDSLLSRGIAWHLSYRHHAAFYDNALQLNGTRIIECMVHFNEALAAARRKRSADDPLDDPAQAQQRELYLDMAGYHVARTIAAAKGDDGLREAIVQGPDHFIEMYNALGTPPIRVGKRG